MAVGPADDRWLQVTAGGYGRARILLVTTGDRLLWEDTVDYWNLRNGTG